MFGMTSEPEEWIYRDQLMIACTSTHDDSTDQNGNAKGGHQILQDKRDYS